MKRDTVNYTLVGGFVVLMAVALVVVLVAVTGRSGPSDKYYVEYGNVTGIKFGTGVFYEGYRVGQVETIEPIPTEHGVRYKVALSVTAGWRIPRDRLRIRLLARACSPTWSIIAVTRARRTRTGSC